MWCRSLVLALLLALAVSAPARASITVTIGDLNLAPGGTGYVDVTIVGEGDLLQACGFEFRIRSIGSIPTRLEFTDPQPYDYLSDSTYVFSGDSFAFANPPAGIVIATVVPGDTFLGGDMTPGSPPTDVTVTDSRLLIRLQVTAATFLPPEVGDSFAISLEPSSSTYFTSSSLAPIGYVSSSAGTVNIVPEPGTMTMALFLIPTAYVMFGRSSRKRS